MSSPVPQLCGVPEQTKNAHATVVSRPSTENIGQTADALWTNHLALRRKQTKTEVDEDRHGRRRRQTKTEVDEDGDGRRRRQTKSKTDSLWGRAKWQLPYS